MSNAFEEASNVELRALRDLLPFIQCRSFEGRMVITDKGHLSPILQKMVGDVLFNSEKNGHVYAVEIKAEETSRHGNLFLEVWSNKSRFTPGWMLTLQADLLFYYFLDCQIFYMFSFRKLKEWAFNKPGRNGHSGRLWDFPEKRQEKYVQMNDTWGRCVPIRVLEQECGYSAYCIRQEAA